mmetsp:Transcript_20115/g.47194  ORF Transcript_20115/g.47194 Transcript_20115/m.47194 type:complete len:437 (-) Transcript_20115:7-1317(-)
MLPRTRLLVVGLPAEKRRLGVPSAPERRRRQQRRGDDRHGHVPPGARRGHRGHERRGRRERTRRAGPEGPPTGLRRRRLRVLASLLAPGHRLAHPAHGLHGNRKLVQEHHRPGAAPRGGHRELPPDGPHRSDGDRRREGLRAGHQADPPVRGPGRDAGGGPGPPEHPGPSPHGHGLPVRPAATVDAPDRRAERREGLPAGPGIRQRRRGPAGVHDEVRLLLGRPEPHRGDLQGRPQADAPVGLRRVRDPVERDPQRDRRRPPDGRAAAQWRQRGRRERALPAGRGGDGHDLRGARMVRTAPQAGPVRSRQHVPEARRRVDLREEEACPRGCADARRGGRQGQALLLLLLDQPAQDVHADAELPRGGLQPRRQPVRPPTLPVQLPVAPPVPDDRPARRRVRAERQDREQVPGAVTISLGPPAPSRTPPPPPEKKKPP